MIQIGKDIRVEEKEFNGKSYIHIRRWYEKDGEMLPGAKGISLTEEEWSEFSSKFDDIKNDINKNI